MLSREYPQNGEEDRALPQVSAESAVLYFCWNERSDSLGITVDADQPGCNETRHSTSSGVIQVNGHFMGE